MTRNNETRPTKAASGATPPSTPFEEQVSYDNSPPRTPPSQISRIGKSKGGTRAPRTRPSLRNAFDGEDETDDPRHHHARDAASNVHNRNRSNSHDLSWSPRNARDSVVDNMLLSLDQWPNNPAASPGATVAERVSFDHQDDSHASASVQRYPPAAGRPRGHTYSSSMSSDPGFQSDSPRSAHTREHRSTSSTNFQSALGRIDSVCLADQEEVGSLKATKDDTMSVQPNSELSKLGHTLRSSGSSSLDLGRNMGGRDWQQAGRRRSSSFDQGFNRPILPPLKSYTSPALKPQANLLYDDFDAAPTPTVPAGPRRGRSPPPTAFRPGSSFSSTQKLPLRRRGSIKTPITLFGRSDRQESSEQTNSRKGSRLHTRNSSKESNAGPLLIAGDTQLKGRNVSNLSNAMSSLPASSPGSGGKERERPGFFKRVFRSSRNVTPTNYDIPLHKEDQVQAVQTANDNEEVEAAALDKTRKSHPVAMSAQRGVPKEKQSAKDQSAQPLNKKTSFFRRRKKSISEPAPPVPLPQLRAETAGAESHTDANTQLPRSQTPRSPANSLRKVMDPYLDDQKANDEHVETRRTSRKPEPHRQVTLPATPPDTEDPPIHADREDNQSRGTPRTLGKASDISSMSTIKGLRTVNDQSEGGALHRKTGSDVDKTLPRLPFDYIAFDKVDQNKESSVSDAYILRPPPRISSLEAPDRDADQQLQLDVPSSAWIQAKGSSPGEQTSASSPKLMTGRNEHARASGSSASDYKSATSKQHSPMLAPEAEVDDATQEHSTFNVKDGPYQPAKEDRLLAKRIFDGEADIDKSTIASWLGEEGDDRARVRRAYMELFSWKDFSILAALRSLCSQVKLKGETQQVDRILDTLSTQWCTCNPSHGFKATGMLMHPSPMRAC